MDVGSRTRDLSPSSRESVKPVALRSGLVYVMEEGEGGLGGERLAFGGRREAGLASHGHSVLAGVRRLRTP